MEVENYKIVLYRQEDGSWVAEIPAISGCYALMPTREQALEPVKPVVMNGGTTRTAAQLRSHFTEAVRLAPPLLQTASTVRNLSR